MGAPPQWARSLLGSSLTLCLILHHGSRTTASLRPLESCIVPLQHLASQEHPRGQAGGRQV